MVAVALIGIGAALLALQLKEMKPEYSGYLALAAGVLIFAFAISQIHLIVETIHKIQSYVNLDSGYVGTLIKIIGITYIAEFGADVCRDCGHNAIGGQIELFAKLSILVLSIPILLALLDTVTQLIQ